MLLPGFGPLPGFWLDINKNDQGKHCLRLVMGESRSETVINYWDHAIFVIAE